MSTQQQSGNVRGVNQTNQRYNVAETTINRYKKEEPVSNATSTNVTNANNASVLT